jgi:hypothetical protein
VACDVQVVEEGSATPSPSNRLHQQLDLAHKYHIRLSPLHIRLSPVFALRVPLSQGNCFTSDFPFNFHFAIYSSSSGSGSGGGTSISISACSRSVFPPFLQLFRRTAPKTSGA